MQVELASLNPASTPGVKSRGLEVKHPVLKEETARSFFKAAALFRD